MTARPTVEASTRTANREAVAVAMTRRTRIAGAAARHWPSGPIARFPADAPARDAGGEESILEGADHRVGPAFSRPVDR